MTALALKHWANSDGGGNFNLELVSKLYGELLIGGDLSQLVMLETTKYLESYLWPNFEQGINSRVFMLSCVWLINEKFRERASVWEFVGQNRDRVSKLFSTVCSADWLRGQALNREERIQLVRFLIGSFQSLANDAVRSEVLKLVHIPLWDAVCEQRRQLELQEAPKAIQKQWRVFGNQKQKGKSFAREAGFIPYLFELLRGILDDKSRYQDEELFIQRCLELFTDLLAQIPTRRFFKMYLEDSLLVPRLRLLQSSFPPLTVKLIQMLKFYLEFEVDELTGKALNSDDMARAHGVRVSRLQRVAFRDFADHEVVKRIAISNVALVGTRAKFEPLLAQLDLDTLIRLCAAVGITGTQDRAVLQEALLLHCQIRVPQTESINRMPLYPTEALLWDRSVIPGDSFVGQAPLALPKLNLQFLTFYDYLLRNYTLYRLEAVDDLAHHVEDVLARMQPTPTSDGKIKFEGWARMALPIRSCRVLHVAEPKLGDSKPAEVRHEIVFSVHHFTGELRAEWEQVWRNDVLFLLTLTEPSAQHPQGLQRIRGCEVLDVFDEQNIRIKAPEQHRQGQVRKLVVRLDPAQYHMDQLEHGTGPTGNVALYESFNLLLRRRPRENVFKGILETVRTLINTHGVAVPEWLADVFLGYGDAKAADPDPHSWLDYGDTFLNAEHLMQSFPEHTVTFENTNVAPPPPPYRVRVAESNHQLLVQSSAKPDAGPFPEPVVRMNRIPFTPRQVEAIGKGARPGLTLVVGPPGTGKTDTAVQILSLIYRNNPGERTIMLTHSNQALNQIFEKLIGLDIDPSCMVRLGHGEKNLASEHSFSQQGRVDFLLTRRLKLLQEVQRLAQSLLISGADAEYTCETARHFFFLHVVSRWEKFTRDVLAQPAEGPQRSQWVQQHFPFSTFFAMAPRQPAFYDWESACSCYRYLERIFRQLDECQPLEVLRNPYDRNRFVLAKHSRIVAMTVVYAGLARRQLIEAGFRFDNLVMEEAGQVKEIESFIPLLLQEDRTRLKRVVLIGDDNQLPPVVKNESFQRYSNLDQSMFARFVRLGVPHVLLDRQGRCRPELASLFNWRYPQLGNLARVESHPSYRLANAGFRWDYQFVDVQDYQGVGEYAPKAHFFQNLGEAEYIVATYMYMRTLGYPAESITILSTYRGQKHLIRDVVEKRCANFPQYGRPGAISTVDKYQGQQNDYVLLSLVRTKAVGYLRDVRRLVVAMSRARYGLYIFGRASLFQNVYELSHVFSLLLKRHTKLELAMQPGERYGNVTRTNDQAEQLESHPVEDAAQMAMVAVSGGNMQPPKKLLALPNK